MDDTLIRILQLGQQGYTCSQIITMLGLELRCEENPGLVRANAAAPFWPKPTAK